MDTKHPRSKVDTYHFCPTTGEQIRFLRTMTPGGRLIVKRDPLLYRLSLWVGLNSTPLQCIAVGIILGAALLALIRVLGE